MIPDDNITISEINFVPVRPSKGHIGFVSFLYNNTFRLDSIGIYTRLNPNQTQSLYRLVYPFDKNGRPCLYPINKETGDFVEKEISSYLENLLNT